MSNMEEETVKIPKKPHKVILENKRRAVITGVEDIDSFNECEIIFLSSEGMITIGGEDLHISKLNLEDGQLIIDGIIDSLDYADHDELRRKKGFFKK